MKAAPRHGPQDSETVFRPHLPASVARDRRQGHSASGNAMIHLFQKGKKAEKRERKGGGKDGRVGRAKGSNGRKKERRIRIRDTIIRNHYVHNAILRALHIFTLRPHNNPGRWVRLVSFSMLQMMKLWLKLAYPCSPLSKE